MEVTALHIRLLIDVLVLLQHSYSHETDATFPRVVPSRLQLFEYESVFISCEGFFNNLTEWRVMKKIKGVTTICNDKWEMTGPCDITTAFTVDSGEYWCEAEGKKSNSVNITVTAGSVILESPALPVTGGQSASLRCRNKKTSNLTADFYKDGILIRSSSTGNMTIYRVSKSDEGLYKCEISGLGESTESWLAVRAGSVVLESPALPVMEGESVTLRCRNRETPNFTADFYKDDVFIWTSSTGNMTIHSVSKSDEGLYKCEISGLGESTESWLTVRAGSVILDSPALPVMEGHAVTLRCRNKKTSNFTNLTADFYKDGLLIRSSSTGNMTIHSVSKSDEGVYTCKISGVGESAGSWLAIRAFQEETLLPDSHLPHVFNPLWMTATVLPVACLLLLVFGLHCMKEKDKDESWTTVVYHAMSTGPEVSHCGTSSLCEYHPTLNKR